MEAILKEKIDQALDNLEQRRIELSNEVQVLEDICAEYEKQARNIMLQNEELCLVLKQVKSRLLEARVDDALELLGKY